MPIAGSAASPLRGGVPYLRTANRVLHVDGSPASYPGSGSTWTDLSSAGNNLTISGLTWNAAGYFTGDGVNDSASRATMSSVPLSTAVSVFAVVRPTSGWTSSIRYLMSLNRAAADNEFMFQMTLEGRGSYSDYNSSQGGDGYVFNNRTTVVNTGSGDWRTFGFVSTNQTAQWYLNGVPDGSGITSNGARTYSSSNLVIGYDPLGVNRYWLGDIGALMIYNASITEADMLNLHHYYRKRLGF